MKTGKTICPVVSVYQKCKGAKPKKKTKAKIKIVAVKKVVIKKNRIIVKKLKRGKLYYFRVRALAKGNNGKIYGSYSSKKKLKIS